MPAPTRTTYGPRGVRLVLDRREIFPNDPGSGTPALVHYAGQSGTLACILAEGEMIDGTTLPDDVYAWLDGQESDADTFLYTTEG